MALLVTILLMLINFAINAGAKSPSMSSVSALDMWMLGQFKSNTYYMPL